MRSRFRNSFCCVAVVAAAFVPAATAAPQNVTVRMTEYHFKLSVTHVHKGVVVFTILNKGQIPHTFSVRSLDAVSSLVQAGKKTTLRLTFKKPGLYYYLCTVGAHEQYGMFGNLRVTK